MPFSTVSSAVQPILLLLVCLTILVFSSWSLQAQSVQLAWDPVSNVTGYRLYSGTSSQTYTQNTDVGNVTHAMASNLTAGKTYFFAVSAYNSAALESGKSNEVSYAVPAGPAAPAAPPPPPTVPAPRLVSVTSSKPNEAVLSWTENDPQPGQFTILYSTSSNLSNPEMVTISGSATSLTISSLVPNNVYYFAVQFTETASKISSAPSNTVACVVGPLPSTVTESRGMAAPNADAKRAATPTATPIRRFSDRPRYYYLELRRGIVGPTP